MNVNIDRENLNVLGHVIMYLATTALSRGASKTGYVERGRNLVEPKCEYRQECWYW